MDVFESSGLAVWLSRLQSPPFSEVVVEPESTAIFAIDVVEGIESGGEMTTSAVAAIVAPIVQLFVRANELGVRQFLLVQEKYRLDDLDYSSYMHIHRNGTLQTDTVDSLKSLSFAERFTVIPKHSAVPAIGTGLSRWLAEHQNLKTVIVVGAGTDLGVYQTAMHLRHRASVLKLSGFRAVVPANCVAAHHHSALQAPSSELTPFSESAVHSFFLYHMALNGIEVVSHFEKSS